MGVEGVWTRRRDVGVLLEAQRQPGEELDAWMRRREGRVLVEGLLREASVGWAVGSLVEGQRECEEIVEEIERFAVV